MAELTMGEILEEIMELEVTNIVFTGYYSNKDDSEELHEHTEATKALYYKGFEETYKGSLYNNEDTFNGVCFDTNNAPLAEWWIDGTEQYFNIS